MVVLFINQSRSGSALIVMTAYRAQRERKERSRRFARSRTNLHGASTALVLRCSRCCLDSTTFMNFVLRFYYAFTALRVHGASTT